MKRIKKLIYSPNKTNILRNNQNSVWSHLKDPVKVISTIIFILLAISPIIGIHLIYSYLSSFHATIIAYSLFSNISSIGVIITYGFTIVTIITLSIFFIPLYFGYISKEVFNKILLNRYYYKSIPKKEIIEIIILCILDIIIICASLYYFLSYTIMSFSILFLSYIISVVLVFEIFNLFFNKEYLNGKIEYKNINNIFSIFWLFIYCFYSFNSFILLLLIESKLNSKITNEYTQWIIIILLILISIFYNAGLEYSRNNKKYNKTFLIVLISMILIVLYQTIFHIPFAKITINYTGMGYRNISLHLKPKTPKYLIAEIQKKINNDIQPEHLIEKFNHKKNINNKKINYFEISKSFLLIQTQNSYYIMKNSKANNIIMIPKRYVFNIRTPIISSGRKQKISTKKIKTMPRENLKNIQQKKK